MKKIVLLLMLLIAFVTPTFSAYQEVETTGTQISSGEFEAHKYTDYYRYYRSDSDNTFGGKLYNRESGKNSTADGGVWVARKTSSHTWTNICGDDKNNVQEDEYIKCSSSTSKNAKQDMDVHGNWRSFPSKYNTFTSNFGQID